MRLCAGFQHEGIITALAFGESLRRMAIDVVFAGQSAIIGYLGDARCVKPDGSSSDKGKKGGFMASQGRMLKKMKLRILTAGSTPAASTNFTILFRLFSDFQALLLVVGML